MSATPVKHTPAYRRRRFLNWFPLGLSYALLYMGRYNLTVAKTSLGELMTKEDFGAIFGVGTFVYALSFLLNGPLVDRRGGRFGMLVSLFGSALTNFCMGFYLLQVLGTQHVDSGTLRWVFSILYGLNMYFQSFGAVSIVKVNAHWFHVSERGSFSGIFGTMISSGIFLAFTVNFWLLDQAKSFWPHQDSQWVVFLVPSVAILIVAVVEFFVLRDWPSQVGFKNIDTADASSGESLEEPIPTLEIFKRILTHPVILTVALVEFCTGVLRNGVMHWFPIYAKEVWALPRNHLLMGGVWDWPVATGVCIAVALTSFFLATRKQGSRKGYLWVAGALAFLAPFIQGGWGGLLFIAGVIGGNVAGWVSDLFFQSRRAPAAAGLYAILGICTLGMYFVLAVPSSRVADAGARSGLLAGDDVVSMAGVRPVSGASWGWAEVQRAFVCHPAQCVDSVWDASRCLCTTSLQLQSTSVARPVVAEIPVVVRRGEQILDLMIPDPKPLQKAGDSRTLDARPVLPVSPMWLGLVIFVMSLCVIGSHGLLSGTATMDFGGRRAAATAVGIIDGFVYLGTALQSVALGYLTTRDWSYWPVFLMPFGFIGFLLLLRIWHAKPTPRHS